jgi:predicted 2-oxoglutarate/Fe(II)-dependent dioxygenase YbiX
LHHDGYAVLDDALTPEAVAACARACAELRPLLQPIASQAQDGRGDASAQLRLAQPGATQLSHLLGNGGVGQPGADAAALASAAGTLMSLSALAGTALGRSLAPPQCLQLACYDNGAGYARHCDAPPDTRAGPSGWRPCDRSVTAILYLNEQWRPEHGGELRLWPPSGGPALDVPPVGGRLLLFDAASTEHEVLPSHARRFALSAWLPRAESVAER